MDMSHTVGSLSRAGGLPGESLEFGFLQWRPGSQLEGFRDSIAGLVSVVGEQGCGWEQSLESWYRFLVDPFPYQELERVSCYNNDTVELCRQPTTDANGERALDHELLAQRTAFLRANSALVIVMLTDENDCSTKVGKQNWIAASALDPMFRSTSACNTNPNDKCCHTCSTAPPEGCQADPICAESLATQAWITIPRTPTPPALSR